METSRRSGACPQLFPTKLTPWISAHALKLRDFAVLSAIAKQEDTARYGSPSSESAFVNSPGCSDAKVSPRPMLIRQGYQV